jgi:hypothetical protein
MWACALSKDTNVLVDPREGEYTAAGFAIDVAPADAVDNRRIGGLMEELSDRQVAGAGCA